MAEAEGDLAKAEEALDAAIASLLASFAGDSRGENDGTTGTGWSDVYDAFNSRNALRVEHERKLFELEEAQNRLEHAALVVGQLNNDLEAELELFAIRNEIMDCQTSACSAADFLTTERFTVFQPHVLETVGVHHAYAKGLTGAGVRIAIEDDIVNYTLPEFAGRVSFDGAVLTYPITDGDDDSSDARRCDHASENTRASLGCKVFAHSTEYDLRETLTVQAAIASNGWPGVGERWFVRNDHHEEGSPDRWSEIPHATSRDRHGTAVASVAAGRDFGIAPGATIVPVARRIAPDGQSAEEDVSSIVLDRISEMSSSDRAALDTKMANDVLEDFSHYDIVNRSHGIGVFDPAEVREVLDDETKWWGDHLRQLLPRTWRAFMQTETHPDDRTVVVYAAGNESEEFGGLGANIPYHEPHVRGHHLSAMAVDHDGSHAAYTNFCGALPSDWDAERWGRHFCLAAPGTVNAAGNAGRGNVFHEIEGTSFAAPVVSGAIALLMEHFRGQLGNSEIVKRVVDTADNSGRYAQLEVYGAGLLDLEAALQPVGSMTTGTPSATALAGRSLTSVPPAIGNLGQRLALQGVEVASLDSLGAPFWSSPAAYVQPIDNAVSTIPDFSEPDEEGDGRLHRGFSPETISGPEDDRGVRLLAGADRIGLERSPVDGLRWGILGDAASWQGGGVSGAFGEGVRSVTAWVGHDAMVELDDAWTLRASATLALGHAFHDPGAMLSIDAHALSTWDVGLERGERGRGAWSRIAFSQPLRAESGDATFTYLAGPRGRRSSLRQRDAVVGAGRPGAGACAHARDADRSGTGRDRGGARVGCGARVR